MSEGGSVEAGAASHGVGASPEQLSRQRSRQPSQQPIQIAIHYDFASSLCYVAHRVMERIAHRFAVGETDPDHPPIEFHWTPLDLAGLSNWNRGGIVPEDRRDNVLRVSRELSVPVRVPRRWLDSRRVNAAAIAIADHQALETLDARQAVEAAWRERVYTAIFDEGRSCDEPEEFVRWARDLGIAFDPAELARAESDLEHRTRNAAAGGVTGVPTFMLSDWAMGGIQDDDTMVQLICRFARRARERGMA